MKKQTFQIIVFIVAVLLMCCAGCSQMAEYPPVSNSIIIDYKDGDTLLPDYSHTDTLIVTDAEKINYRFIKSQPATDGEISEALGEGTRKK